MYPCETGINGKDIKVVPLWDIFTRPTFKVILTIYTVTTKYVKVFSIVPEPMLSALNLLALRRSFSGAFW
jgi:hypothetical protein